MKVIKFDHQLIIEATNLALVQPILAANEHVATKLMVITKLDGLKAIKHQIDYKTRSKDLEADMSVLDDTVNKLSKSILKDYLYLPNRILILKRYVKGIKAENKTIKIEAQFPGFFKEIFPIKHLPDHLVQKYMESLFDQW